MLKPLIEPSLEKHPGTGKTAFERNLLPDFARWFIERLDSHRPDYLVPAETKGARLLEAVSDYARHELGAPIQVPVLYRTAFPYIEPEVLRDSRVMVLEDAVRTGSSLARHRESVERWGVKEVAEAICIGFTGEEGGRHGEDCYLLVEDAELYREYVWQLTELVRAPGLPPEVDHHVFEMRLPGPLAMVWGELEAALGQFGALSVDAPETEWGDVCGLTLHFPALPGLAEFPTDGPVRNVGPNKLRLFPQEDTGTVYVVPVSFPALDVSGAPRADLGLERTRELLRGWMRRDDSSGELLAELAHKHAPEAVFRMLSASAETDLVCGFARVIGAILTPDAVSIEPQRGLFCHLYGPAVGARFADSVAEHVREALADEDACDPASLVRREPAVPLFLSEAVLDSTGEVAERLKQLYEERKTEPDFSPEERVGRTLGEIAAVLDDDRLLASRCVDFGLAMTTLVPYVEERPCGENRIVVERRYRVSEANRGFPFEDMDTVYEEIGAETIAFCSAYLAEHSERYRGTYLPLEVGTALVAIMRPMLEKLELPIEVAPGQPDPKILLRPHPRPVSPRESNSPFFVIETDGEQHERVVPSPHFRKRCAEDRLRIDRWEIVEHIENFLDLMLPLLDGLEPEQLREVLAGWAMSSDRLLGLTHVQAAIEEAVATVSTPLNTILRGSPHRRSTGVAERVGEICAAARADLDILAGDWSSEAKASWPHHSKRVRQLLQSGAPPTQADSLFELPAALLTALEALALLATQLDAVSDRRWHEQQGDGDEELVAEICGACAAMRRSLASLEGVELLTSAVPKNPPSIGEAAERLLELAGVLAAFAAALITSFRGPKGLHAVHLGENNRDRAILFMDLADSFAHSIEHSPEGNERWKKLALGCAAQWGKAFGGSKPRDPEGDAIWLEFESVAAAVLCGAAIQAHAGALRSTGVAQLQWALRMAVDVGRIHSGDDGNSIGLALDRPATLAKKVRDEDSIKRVLVTPTAAERCPPTIHDEPWIALLGEEVTLAEIDHPAATMEPWSVNSQAALHAAAANVDAVAQRVAATFPAAEGERLDSEDLRQGEEMQQAESG